MERSFQQTLGGGTAVAPADTRARVIRAAAELFAARGFAGTSISAIREASGTRSSSIYWEFGSKEGILAAVLEDAATRWHEHAFSEARRIDAECTADGPARLTAFLEALADALAARPEFLRLLLLLALERRDVDARSLQAIRNVRQRAVEDLAQFFIESGIAANLRPGLDLMELARGSLAFFDGSFIAAQIDPETTDLRRAFSLVRLGFAAFVRDTHHGGDDA